MAKRTSQANRAKGKGSAPPASAPPAILELVERFRRNRDSYRDPAYKEAQVRREFIDPFFEALGWDIANLAGHAEAYKDVVHEDALKIGAATKAPDYSFRVGGRRVFFVEAKKPSVDLEGAAPAAYQLRRYAWSAGLALSILTDFEELAVYDCTVRPRPADKPSVARILSMTFEDYAARWAEIAAVFSKEAVLQGSFDRFAGSAGRKRGTATVDEAFLGEIESWRDALAHNLALRNRLDVRDLNAAVQLTIDRIIFLRMCEDRGIEDYGALMALTNGPSIYPRLVALFERADDKYNSGLFHFRTEAARPPPDELTPGLKVDDKVLAAIIRGLYYPESPYEFSVLGADILGQVYEQFLGKVIRLTASGQAKVEEKPEVKKAGGVYYTPAYIVRYIVQNTVGRMLEGRAPADIGGPAAKKVSHAPGTVGPAPCGRPPADSDSPLPSRERGGGEGALPPLDTLTRPPSGFAGASPDRSAATLSHQGRGTIAAPRRGTLRILDPACGSGSFLIGAYQYLLDWHRDWYAANGPERFPRQVYQGPGGRWNLTIEEKKRLLLAHIFGVDIDSQAVEVTKLSLLLKVLEGESQDSLERQRRLFHVERALPDLSSNIKCGNSLIGPDFFQGRQLALFDDEEVRRVNAFDWAAEFPAILGPKVPAKRRGFDVVIGNPPYGRLFNDDESQYLNANCPVFACLKDAYVAFTYKAHCLLRGGGRFGYIVPSAWLGGPAYKVMRRWLLSYTIETLIVLPFNVFADAYIDTAILTTAKCSPPSDHSVVVHAYPKKQKIDAIDANQDRFGHIAQASWLECEGQKFLVDPEIAPLLKRIRDRDTVALGTRVRMKRGVLFDREILTRKKCGQSSFRYFEGDVYRYCLRFAAPNWVEYGAKMREFPREFDWFQGKRILLRRLVNRRQRLMATILDRTVITNKNLYVLKVTGPEAIEYLLGALNSRLLSRLYLAQVSQATKDDFPQVSIADSLSLPIRPIDLSDPADKSRHDLMVSLVERMLDLNKRLAGAKGADERMRFQRLIDATDREIDALVYDLYGLTADEIRIVEEATG